MTSKRRRISSEGPGDSTKKIKLENEVAGDEIDQDQIFEKDDNTEQLINDHLARTKSHLLSPLALNTTSVEDLSESDKTEAVQLQSPLSTSSLRSATQSPHSIIQPQPQYKHPRLPYQPKPKVEKIATPPPPPVRVPTPPPHIALQQTLSLNLSPQPPPSPNHPRSRRHLKREEIDGGWGKRSMVEKLRPKYLHHGREKSPVAAWKEKEAKFVERIRKMEGFKLQRFILNGVGERGDKKKDTDALLWGLNDLAKFQVLKKYDVDVKTLQILKDDSRIKNGGDYEVKFREIFQKEKDGKEKITDETWREVLGITQMKEFKDFK